jgi:DNA-directed RNA polymerase subunit M/transcription elongation factor TFIIS
VQDDARICRFCRYRFAVNVDLEADDLDDLNDLDDDLVDLDDEFDADADSEPDVQKTALSAAEQSQLARELEDFYRKERQASKNVSQPSPPHTKFGCPRCGSNNLQAFSQFQSRWYATNIIDQTLAYACHDCGYQWEPPPREYQSFYESGCWIPLVIIFVVVLLVLLLLSLL